MCRIHIHTHILVGRWSETRNRSTDLTIIEVECPMIHHARVCKKIKCYSLARPRPETNKWGRSAILQVKVFFFSFGQVPKVKLINEEMYIISSSKIIEYQDDGEHIFLYVIKRPRFGQYPIPSLSLKVVLPIVVRENSSFTLH